MTVEDEPDIGVILRQILGSQYEVVSANNGLEALERLSWYQPDLTIMDLMMPVLDGFDTTRAIKKDNEYTSMPVMFLTARKDNQAVREALMAGGDVYLEKPFDPPELLTRLREMVEKNSLVPRPKRYTLDQIKAHFEGSSEKIVPAAAPAPAGGSMSLTAQLARAAAEPKPRVLVINDSEQALHAIKEELKPRNEVIVALDPESALDKIAAYQPDVLVVDTEMPTFNGFHLVQLLRVNRHLRVPHVVFLSERDGEAVRSEAHRLKGRLLAGDSVTPVVIASEVKTITQGQGFQRQRKRLDYREILRREEPEDDDY